jgi:hypothetical protein
VVGEGGAGANRQDQVPLTLNNSQFGADWHCCWVMLGSSQLAVSVGALVGEGVTGASVTGELVGAGVTGAEVTG